MTVKINAASRLRAAKPIFKTLQDADEHAKKRFVDSFVFKVTEGNESYLDAFSKLLEKSSMSTAVLPELEKRCVEAANKVIMFAFIKHHSYDNFLDTL